MVAGAPDTAFRAQLVLSEQQQLYDYWCNKHNQQRLPTRQQINPSEISKLLPNLSLIDIEPDPWKFRYRLAGTRLREIYDCEVTGLELSDCDLDVDYWKRAYIHITETGRPAQGVIRGPGAEKEHLVQFWLRLPLATAGNSPVMLLGHDAVVPAEQLSGTADLELQPHFHQSIAI